MVLFIVYENEPDRVRRIGDVLADDADKALAAAKARYGCATWAQLMIEPAE
jgi:hypothetical protein